MRKLQCLLFVLKLSHICYYTTSMTLFNINIVNIRKEQSLITGGCLEYPRDKSYASRVF